VWVHLLGKHQKFEVLALFDLGVAQLDLEALGFGCYCTREHRIHGWLQFLADVFDDQHFAAGDGVLQLGFESFVVEGGDFEVLKLSFELLGSL